MTKDLGDYINSEAAARIREKVEQQMTAAELTAARARLRREIMVGRSGFDARPDAGHPDFDPHSEPSGDLSIMIPPSAYDGEGRIKEEFLSYAKMAIRHAIGKHLAEILPRNRYCTIQIREFWPPQHELAARKAGDHWAYYGPQDAAIIRIRIWVINTQVPEPAPVEFFQPLAILPEELRSSSADQLRWKVRRIRRRLSKWAKANRKEIAIVAFWLLFAGLVAWLA